MEAKEIKKLIRKGESVNLEFKAAKEKLPSSFFETVCAFLNRDGGKIILGVSDNGEIEGINESKVSEIMKQISNLSNNREKLDPPSILCSKRIVVDDKHLLYIDVPRGSQVHSTKNKIFDRSTDGDYEITDYSQKSALFNRKSSQFSETKVYPYLELRHFKSSLFDKFRNLLRGIEGNDTLLNLSNEELLRALGLYREDLESGSKGYTLASILLFGTDETIQSALPHFKIDALLRIRDLERYDDRLEVRTNLIEAYEQLMGFINKHLPDPFFEEDGQRVSLRYKIFREVIANILVHTEYTIPAFSRLVIYKDRVETENPSRPFRTGAITLDNLSPKPKNPSLAKAFIQTGRVEELGSGVRKTNRYVPIYSNGLKPEFYDGDVFRMIIPVPEVKTIKNDAVKGVRVIGYAEEVGRKLGEKLGEKHLRIIREMETDPKITISRLAIKLDVSTTTIENNISFLKKHDYIVRIGSAKGGHWQINKEI